MNVDIWLSKISGLERIINDVPTNKSWLNSDLLPQTHARVLDGFKKDIEALENEALFIFSNQTDVEHLAQQSEGLLKKWHIAGAPSLTAMCVFALENFGLNPQEDLVHAILICSILGEVENNLAYHNNMHYRKVLFNLLRLLAIHNDIYKDTARSFDASQIGLLMMGACAHDVGHDGMGNTVKGVFTPGRLEKLSYDLTLPYLTAVGFTDEKLLADFRVMILCTEVTPLDDLGNPMNQMKAAYRFHYLGDKTKTHTLNLDPDLVALELDQNLTMMCLILHEADIATSAGITYDVTKFETSLYMREIGTKQARPQHVLDFLDQICKRQFLSDAGQRLYAGNLARIYARAEQEVEEGDHIFPAAEHSDFILPHARGESSKTIN